MIIPTISFAMSNQIDLGKGTYISSVASHENTVVLAGFVKKEDGKRQAVVYVSNQFKKWKSVKATFLKDATKADVIYSVFRKSFLLVVKQPNENQVVISKNTRNWEVTQEKNWATVIPLKLDGETTRLVWNGFKYKLYNDHHKTLVSIWSVALAGTSTSPVNTEFESFCLMQGNLIVSGASQPTPISYTRDLYEWIYPISLFPKTKRGSKIYRLHCLKNNVLIGTGKVDGTFVFEPYTKGMLVYAKVDENKKINFHHMDIDTPIIASTMLDSELHMIIWNKKKKELSYVSQNISKPLGSFTFHGLISKKVGSFPQMTITHKKRIIIVGGSLLYEYKLP